ncbi:hypothetical protein RvY_02116 [Ramazzottius varieornatus]|uniref:Uncharacterized protein n=1 Tax=Ramazzottius varieornatus TaxID=947166 RepID=A0A1D1UJG1_RAMVA|nr:hypothetical protein RvY_02116 [Ramazzottius varieornatus]
MASATDKAIGITPMLAEVANTQRRPVIGYKVIQPATTEVDATGSTRPGVTAQEDVNKDNAEDASPRKICDRHMSNAKKWSDNAHGWNPIRSRLHNGVLHMVQILPAMRLARIATAQQLRFLNSHSTIRDPTYYRKVKRYRLPGHPRNSRIDSRTPFYGKRQLHEVHPSVMRRFHFS